MGDLSKLKRSPDQAPVLKILSGHYKGKQFRLLSSEIKLGRGNQCDIVFKNNQTCSREHARILWKGEAYIIETMNPKNPVVVNKKVISSYQLLSGDRVKIGDIDLLFLDKSPIAIPRPVVSGKNKIRKPKKSILTVPRTLIIALLFSGLYFLTFNDQKKETEKFSFKTEEEALEEIEVLKKINQEELEKTQFSSAENLSQIAFITGFRDYRKGYFQRALKSFEHCLTSDKNKEICLIYVTKSKVQIEKLIQKKFQLGNSYKKNKQYQACRAAFKSVELMVKDSRSLVYKEARENRKLCDMQMSNKI